MAAGSTFCGWIETLPYAELITGNNAENERSDSQAKPENPMKIVSEYDKKGV